MYLYMYMYICMMCLVHHMYNIQCVIMYTPIHYITLHVCSSLTKPSFWKSQPATKAATWGNQEPHTTECWFPIGLPSGFIGGCNGKPPMNEVYSWENHRTKMVWWYCFCPDPLFARSITRLSCRCSIQINPMFIGTEKSLLEIGCQNIGWLIVNS